MAVFAFGLANAQDVKFGVKGGLNLSSLTGDIEDAKSLIGFHIGGFAEIKLTDKFAIQPELLYSTQGSKMKETVFTESFEYNNKLDYLNIPVMAKYYVTEAFNVEVGPQIGILLSAKVDGEDYKDEVKSVDFGLGFGAGYNFTENLSLGLRYNLGLSNTIKEDSDYKVKNSVLALSLAYKF